MPNTRIHTPSPATMEATQAVDALADQAATKADATLDSLRNGVDHLREAVPGAFARAAAQVEELTRRGVDRAREAGQVAREQALRAGDATVMKIRDEPVKAVLVAAAAGAALAALIGWMARSRNPRA